MKWAVAKDADDLMARLESYASHYRIVEIDGDDKAAIASDIVPQIASLQEPSAPALQLEPVTIPESASPTPVPSLEPVAAAFAPLEEAIAPLAIDFLSAGAFDRINAVLNGIRGYPSNGAPFGEAEFAVCLPGAFGLVSQGHDLAPVPFMIG